MPVDTGFVPIYETLDVDEDNKPRYDYFSLPKPDIPQKKKEVFDPEAHAEAVKEGRRIKKATIEKNREDRMFALAPGERDPNLDNEPIYESVAQASYPTAEIDSNRYSKPSRRRRSSPAVKTKSRYDPNLAAEAALSQRRATRANRDKNLQQSDGGLFSRGDTYFEEPIYETTAQASYLSNDYGPPSPERDYYRSDRRIRFQEPEEERVRGHFYGETTNKSSYGDHARPTRERSFKPDEIYRPAGEFRGETTSRSTFAETRPERSRSYKPHEDPWTPRGKFEGGTTSSAYGTAEHLAAKRQSRKPGYQRSPLIADEGAGHKKRSTSIDPKAGPTERRHSGSKTRRRAGSFNGTTTNQTNFNQKSSRTKSYKPRGGNPLINDDEDSSKSRRRNKEQNDVSFGQTDPKSDSSDVVGQLGQNTFFQPLMPSKVDLY